jgi:hypothetical protein
LKITAVLDPAALTVVIVPPGTAHMEFVIDVGGRKTFGRFNAKSVRRAIATINEHGPENVATIVQGRLARGDRLEDAGLAAQLKISKAA